MSIGRNDPCPCGSGKKYKKCCLSKNEPKSSSQLLGNVKVIRSMPSMLNRISPMAPKAQPDEAPKAEEKGSEDKKQDPKSEA